MNNNEQFKKNESQIGILWEKQSASGIKYFSGVLNLTETEKINIVIFKNSGKSEKSPTHIILKSKPRQKTEEPINNSNFENLEGNQEDIIPF